MGITRIGPRLTVTEQMSRNPVFRDRPLAVEVSGSGGFSKRAVDVIGNLEVVLAVKDVCVKIFTPQGVELNSASLIGKTGAQIDSLAVDADINQAVAACKPQIEIPEMIDDLRLSFRIIKHELTVREFLQVVSPDEITGHNAKTLQAILKEGTKADALKYLSIRGQNKYIDAGELQDLFKGGTKDDALTYVSLWDQREYVKRVNRQTGRQLRGITKEDWRDILRISKSTSGKRRMPDEEWKGLLKNRLTGSNWFWLETETHPGSGIYILTSLHRAFRNTDHRPGSRYDSCAIRLVEAK